MPIQRSCLGCPWGGADQYHASARLAVAKAVVECNEAPHGVGQHADAFIAEVDPQLVEIVGDPFVGVRGAWRDCRASASPIVVVHKRVCVFKRHEGIGQGV